MPVSDATILLEALRALPGFGPRRLKLLVEALPRLERLPGMARADLRELPGIGRWLARKLPGNLDLDAARSRLHGAVAAGAIPLGLDDPAYPSALRGIYDPPTIVYLTGTLAEGDASPLVAMVGARRASRHGTEMAKQLAAELVEAGVTVVSGLAHGIDGAAHRGALAGRGPTVAVLASGADRIAPAGHTDLAAAIVASGGALVSEYPPGTQAARGHFPARNRIVSGLASGVVVVEAGAGSGALITAEFALEQGRSVLAVPGRPTDPNAAGTLALLRDGATMVTTSDDVLLELGWARAPKAGTLPELNDGEHRLLAVIRQWQPASIETLVTEAGLPPPVLLAMLVTLEVKEVVARTDSGRWRTAIPPAQPGFRL